MVWECKKEHHYRKYFTLHAVDAVESINNKLKLEKHTFSVKPSSTIILRVSTI